MPLSLPAYPFAFVDLETTGATITRDRITEIAIVSFDGSTSHRWSQLVNPEARIPPFIEQLTGISNEMVSDQPVFADIAAEVLARLEGHVFVAHNARFDYGFLKNEFKRLDLTFRATVLCTVKLSRALFPEHHKHNLDSLITRHALLVSARHRALADAEAIFQFWQMAQMKFPAATLSAAVRELTARPSLPSHLDADLVDLLPRSHGVYFFYGENRLPIYVGKSNNVRQRVLSHFSSDHAIAKEMSISQQVRQVEWIECEGEIDALITEARLIKELQPTLNRQLRRNSEFCSWQLVEQTAGALQPRLVYGRDLDLGSQARLYGLYKSAASARESLMEMAKQYQLCTVTLGIEKALPGKPCFAYQLRQCKGACTGAEPLQQHNLRLIEALTKIRLKVWPFAGAALLAEGNVHHVIDAWCYLGSASTEQQVAQLLEQGKPSFDRDTYRILLKYLSRMKPVGAASEFDSFQANGT